MAIISYTTPLRWEVADATALALQEVKEAEIGYLCRQISDNTLWKATKAGTGASIWTLNLSNFRDGLAVVTLTDGANIAWDMSQGNLYQVTLAGNRTLDNPTKGVPGKRYVLKVLQDATGSRTLALGTYYLSAGGAYTPTATAAHYDYLVVTCISSTLYLVQTVMDAS